MLLPAPQPLSVAQPAAPRTPNLLAHPLAPGAVGPLNVSCRCLNRQRSTLDHPTDCSSSGAGLRRRASRRIWWWRPDPMADRPWPRRRQSRADSRPVARRRCSAGPFESQWRRRHWNAGVRISVKAARQCPEHTLMHGGAQRLRHIFPAL